MYYPLDLEGQTEVCMHGSFCDMDILLHISFPFFFFFLPLKISLLMSSNPERQNRKIVNGE